jgi:hypothetical protein
MKAALSKHMGLLDWVLCAPKFDHTAQNARNDIVPNGQIKIGIYRDYSKFVTKLKLFPFYPQD